MTRLQRIRPAPGGASAEKHGGGIATFARNVQALLRRSWPLAVVLMMATTTAVTAQEVTDKDQVNVGAAPSTTAQVRKSAEAEKGLRLEPTRKFEFADHVANGVAMRNRTSGTIALRGAPVPSRILAALLYVNFSDGSREGQRTVPVLFDGNLVVA